MVLSGTTVTHWDNYSSCCLGCHCYTPLLMSSLNQSKQGHISLSWKLHLPLRCSHNLHRTCSPGEGLSKVQHPPWTALWDAELPRISTVAARTHPCPDIPLPPSASPPEGLSSIEPSPREYSSCRIWGFEILYAVPDVLPDIKGQERG